MRRSLLIVVSLAMVLLAWPVRPAGAVTSQFGPPVTLGSMPAISTQNPVGGGIAVDTAGNVYAADQNDDEVLELPRGAATAKALPFTGLFSPRDVAVDDAGDVFVADWQNSRIMELPAGASSAVQLNLGFALFEPYAIAVNPEGTQLFIAYAGAPARDTVAWVVMQPGTGNTKSVEDVLASVNPAPRGLGLALTPAGNLYVADSTNQRVLELTAGSQTPVTVASWIGVGSNFGGLDAIATDPTGDVFVNPGGTSITELPAGGGPAEQIASPPFFIYGENLAADVAGNVYTLLVPRVGTSTVVEYPAVLPTGTLSISPSQGSPGSTISVSSSTACPLPYTTGVQLYLDNSSGGMVASQPALLSTSSGNWAGTLTVPPTTPRGSFFVTAECQSQGLDLENTNFAPFSVVGIATATVLHVAPNPAVTGQAVTLLAGPVPASEPTTPTGSVTFFANGTALATVPLNGGVASYTTAFSAGSDSLTATYSGDSLYNASGSSVTVLTINRAPTALVAAPASKSAADFSAVLTNATTHQAIGGATVVFATRNLAGGWDVVCSAVTNTAGGAACHGTIPFIDRLIDSSYAAAFEANSNFLGSSTTAPLR